MGYNYLFMFAGASIVGSMYMLRQLKTARLKQAAQAGFETYRARQNMCAFSNPMTQKEALQILGLKDDAPKEKIMSSHKKLMLLNHPDNGGSTYIATKVNQAKEVLLESME